MQQGCLVICHIERKSSILEYNKQKLLSQELFFPLIIIYVEFQVYLFK